MMAWLWRRIPVRLKPVLTPSTLVHTNDTVERDVPMARKYTVIVTVRDNAGHVFTGDKAVTIGLSTFWNQIDYILYVLGFIGLVMGLRWALTHNREPALQGAE